ncbi:MAG: DUF4910 domain-containing protein [Lachnospiraceae bacterium]|nr:DUF4910 domain-containing protein [Lachnospiraceae bacterium]
MKELVEEVISAESLDAGKKIYEFADLIFPICRSISGDGVRETLKLISEKIKNDTERDLKIFEVPSGSSVFDWTVPKEWKIRDAYIENENHEKIIDFKNNNLHVLGYSTPVDEWVDLEELKTHIYTEPSQPDAIPYVTSYYKERFGFCMSENMKNGLKPGKYHMYIDSELFDGSLSYAELKIKGKSEEEVFLSTYTCHPSMANNECSGPALMTELIKFVSDMAKSEKGLRYSYRFIFIPETIGSITYLSRNLPEMKKNVIAGFNLSCVGDDRAYSIVHSRYANTFSDKVLMNVLKFMGEYKSYSFLKRGSDERQYNAPGVDLPVVTFCRSKYCEYPEYHTSLDTMDLVSERGFAGAYEVMTQCIKAIEANYKYKMNVLCEPQLGKRGLYPSISRKGTYDAVKSLTDFIAYSDGSNDLFDISKIIEVPVKELIPIADKLFENDLISRV